MEEMNLIRKPVSSSLECGIDEVHTGIEGKGGLQLNNNDIVTWFIVIAIIAFVVMCVFLIHLLRTAQRSLVTAQGAIGEVKMTVESLQVDIKKLAENVNLVADDLKGKLQTVDPLFDAVQDVGLLLREVTGTARIATQQLTQTYRKQAAAVETGNEKIPAWLQWAAVGSRIFIGARKGWAAQELSRSKQEEKI
jgi:uncharacterized protein YoxC